jgi:hypothetical protein
MTAPIPNWNQFTYVTKEEKDIANNW